MGHNPTHPEFHRDGIAVFCGDAAHRKEVRDTLQANGLDLDACDIVVPAGGLRFMRLKWPVRIFAIWLVMMWINIYRDLHKMHFVYIVPSQHCGAYGGEAHITLEQRQDAEAFQVRLIRAGYSARVFYPVYPHA